MENRITDIRYIRSRSKNDTIYKIRFWKSGRVDCDCIGFSMRKKCAHVEYAKERWGTNE